VPACTLQVQLVKGAASLAYCQIERFGTRYRQTIICNRGNRSVRISIRADFRCEGIHHYGNGAAQHGALKNAILASREVVRQARAAEGLHASHREND
jgi:hypothetical protein